jgi:uncharacterized membrane protein
MKSVNTISWQQHHIRYTFHSCWASVPFILCETSSITRIVLHRVFTNYTEKTYALYRLTQCTYIHFLTWRLLTYIRIQYSLLYHFFTHKHSLEHANSLLSTHTHNLPKTVWLTLTISLKHSAIDNSLFARRPTARRLLSALSAPLGPLSPIPSKAVTRSSPRRSRRCAWKTLRWHTRY